MYNKIIQIRGQALCLINRHWFKIGLACLALYAFINREFSFSISIKAPVEVPANNTEASFFSKKETLTDNGLSTKKTSNQFDFIPNWSKEASVPLIKQLQKLERSQIEQFVNRFSAIAAAEQDKFDIPASIILADALLKSNAGTSSYAKEGANYFTLPCSNDWDGGTQDGFNGCLRRYDNAWQSYRDHSLYLTTGANAGLSKIGSTNYQSWAKTLGHLNKDEEGFEQQLLVVIREFKLDRI